MSDIFFRELKLPTPRYNLGISSQTHGAMTGRMLEGIETILLDERPDLVVVYGDTNSTAAGAMAAAKLHIPVAHVEAGLRSFNRRMPEELNRIVTDHLATLQFCPTAASVENLRREGIVENVHHTGDVMYDATLFAIDAVGGRSRIAEFGLDPGAYAVCTIHRAENTDSADSLRHVCDYLKQRAAEQPLIVPLHPRTRKMLAQFGLDLGAARIVDPLGYFDLHGLLAGANMIYSDSGGLQKEAYFHGKPCVTLRDETEWVETVASGWNRLWHQADYVTPRRPIDEYGDGNAAEKIASIIRNFLERRREPS